MKVLIIGNGIAGITAAREVRKNSDCQITVVSSETKHFFSRTALMYIYMGHMKYEHTKPYEDSFWEKNGIELVFDHAISLDVEAKKVKLRSGTELFYDKVLLATGSRSSRFNWPGQDLDGVQGLYSYQDLELLEKNTHPMYAPSSRRRVGKAVIVGGGLIGVELAEMLHSRGIQVNILNREDRYWGSVLPLEESDLILNHLQQHGIEVKLETELKEIHAGVNGRVGEVLTTRGENIECQFVGLTAGVTPNIDFIRESPIETDRGILVNRRLETNVPDVYAAGDCAQISQALPGRKSIEQVWYTGRMMGEVAGRNMAGQDVEYSPGPWFNSAKFFDLEYQTYGSVGKDLAPDELSFFWKDNSGRKCIRIVSDRETGRFKGINSIGIRLRHKNFDHWIRKAASTDHILENFRQAVFDPEFFKDEVPGIVRSYNAETGKGIKARTFSWKNLLA